MKRDVAKKVAKISAADAKALLRAIELGLVPKVKALAQKGSVDVLVPQTYGGKTTPLFEAARFGNAEIVGLLLAAGGSVRGEDEYGRSVLHGVRDVAVATKLIDAGADVLARDKRKRTPLHLAAERGEAELVKLLVDRGAELEAKDADGKTPYACATNVAVRTQLKKLGAKGLENKDGAPLKPKTRAAAPAEVDVGSGAIAVDAGGHVWIGGDRAIFCWDGKKVTAYDFDESFSVSEMAAGASGRLYVSTNWGLVVKDGDAWRLYGTQNSDLHDQHITELSVDRHGRACVMGYGGEEKVDRPISVFDGKNFEVWTADTDHFPAGLEANRIAFDANNRLVFGTRSGLVFSDGTTWKVPGGLGLLGSVNVLAPNGEGVWAAAQRGVHHVTPAGKTTTSIKTPSGPQCVLVDGDTLWIGMSYGGLLRVRGDDHKHFKRDTGLEEEDVKGLALGADGTVWIAAGNAVFHCRGDAIARFEGPSVTLKPTARAVEPAPAPKKKKTKRLTPLPTKPLVPRAKLAPHVVKAFEAAKLEGLPSSALFHLVRPAIGIMIGKAAAVAVGGSKLGGRPDLPAGVKWPKYRDEDDRYLPFLFQINLAEIAKYDLEGLLPKKGRLLFFCDTQPDEISDSRVLFDDGSKKAARAPWPEDLVDRKGEDDFVAQLPEHALAFYPTWTLPSVEYLEQHAELTETDREARSTLEDELHAPDPKGSSTTRLLGWPDTLQGEIVGNANTIVLLQLDGEMKGPKKLGELFSYWGNGIAHYLIGAKDLAAKKLQKAGAELAYT